MTVKLSALVVAHNEERHLPECLASLTFADEIVVVLDRSTDHSYRISRKFTNRVMEGAWKIEGERRNFGIEQCTGEWILEIDADERVTKELAEEIRHEIKGESRYNYYHIPFDNYIGKILVKEGWGCYWGVRSAPRLSRKGRKKWGNATVHPSYEIFGEGGKFKNPIIHYVDDDISDMIRRFDRYTNANAKDLLNKDDIGSLLANIRRIFSRFFKCYVLRKGYKEGMYGFLNASFAGLYPIVSHLKAREAIRQKYQK